MDFARPFAVMGNLIQNDRIGPEARNEHEDRGEEARRRQEHPALGAAAQALSHAERTKDQERRDRCQPVCEIRHATSVRGSLRQTDGHPEPGRDQSDLARYATELSRAQPNVYGNE